MITLAFGLLTHDDSRKTNRVSTEDSKLRAFHNDPAIKQKYLDRVAAHRAADELIKGIGWENGKGCAIGCTLEVYDHARYETELGIPQMLAMLEDTIFEGLPNGESQAWPERFLSAIEPGVDLSRVGWQFLHWLLTESGIGEFQHELVKDAVSQCAAVLVPLTLGQFIGESAACAARSAESAARSAASAARSAACAARSAACAARIAESAAWSAESAARSAESAACAARSAESAARSAESAAWSAESAARSAAYKHMADKLIELLSAAGDGRASDG